MGIAEQHFDLVVELVMETLEDHAVGEEHLGSIAKAFEPYRSVIVMGNDTDG